MTHQHTQAAVGTEQHLILPVPEGLHREALHLWWQSFGPPGIRPGSRPIRPENTLVAIGRDGVLAGVMGLRDSRGGFLAKAPACAILYRPAPATEDLIVDGIVVSDRRRGIGQALLSEGVRRARANHHLGLRAEVQARNHAARAFYAANGFHEVSKGWFGWPWSGKVLILRRAV